LQQLVPRQFKRDQIVQMQTFRRRVLDVSHVEVETSAVQKKASVARWFFVISVMQIDGASFGLSKEIILNFGWPT
jgi:hypothetical protein